MACGNVSQNTSNSAKTTAKSSQTFTNEIDLMLACDDPAIREEGMKRQVSRSIRRMTGTDLRGTVSEEALFAGVVGLNVLMEAGRETYDRFAERVRQLTNTPEAGRSTEQAAKIALQELQAKKLISKNTATNIYSNAFAASQLDQESRALYDAIGGRRDKTTAVAAFRAAVASGVAKREQIERGELSAPTRDIREFPFGQRLRP